MEISPRDGGPKRLLAMDQFPQSSARKLCRASRLTVGQLQDNARDLAAHAENWGYRRIWVGSITCEAALFRTDCRGCWNFVRAPVSILH